MKNKKDEKIFVLRVQYYYDEDGNLLVKEDMNSGITGKYE